MKRFTFGSLLLAALVALVGTAFAQNIKADLQGFEEVPPISSAATGQFRAKINKDLSIDYTLTYSGLEADATASHIHFGQSGVSGGIVVFLCQTGVSPAGTADETGHAPFCPARQGTVRGTITAANVTNRAAAQGIEGDGAAGATIAEYAEFVKAIRDGIAYANVHSTKFPSGEIRGQIK
jgi:hypothetical protein